MKILTDQDYKLVIATCCSCGFPDCEEPRRECQSINGYADLAWELAVWNGSKYDYFLTYNVDWADGGYIHRSYDQGYNAYLNGYPTVTSAAISIATETVDQAEPYTGATTTSHSGLIDIPAAQQSALAAINGNIPWDDEELTFGTECNAKTELMDPYAAVVDNLFTTTYSRYRMGIPSGYTRSYYEIQWDEAFFPQAWLDWYADYETWLAEHNAYLAAKSDWDTCMAAEWGGSTEICGDEPVEPDPFETPEPSPRPSLIANRSFLYDGSSEFSDWYEMPIPTEDGENRVVNVMVKCYKYSGHGVKPKSFGQVIVLEE